MDGVFIINCTVDKYLFYLFSGRFFLNDLINNILESIHKLIETNNDNIEQLNKLYIWQD